MYNIYYIHIIKGSERVSTILFIILKAFLGQHSVLLHKHMQAKYARELFCLYRVFSILQKNIAVNMHNHLDLLLYVTCCLVYYCMHTNILQLAVALLQ